MKQRINYWGELGGLEAFLKKAHAEDEARRKVGIERVDAPGTNWYYFPPYTYNCRSSALAPLTSRRGDISGVDSGKILKRWCKPISRSQVREGDVVAFGERGTPGTEGYENDHLGAVTKVVGNKIVVTGQDGKYGIYSGTVEAWSSYYMGKVAFYHCDFPK